ncbi:MAG: sigma-54-dependent Fis family transcriptional regulator [Deltaproteobacteria bacterium]|nr:sigma-54-dependent Fis family transcriptional regulator [Deltaproteobacteria bacterium]
MKTRPPQILIVDDDREVRWALRSLVEREDMEAVETSNGEEAIKCVSHQSPDVVLLDIRMPGVDGIEVLSRLGKMDGDLPVIMITAFGSIKDAVRTVKSGAYDYLTKPFENELVLLTIRRALNERKLKRRLRAMDSHAEERFSLQEMMGRSQAICSLEAEVALVAPTDFTVLVTGETGVGKELVARAIHASSHRVSGRMVAVNCGAIPETLIESELFGYEKGAFTGADRTKRGKFEAASSGTLLLDEISSLPFTLQGRLLRVLQERRFYRLGGTEEISAEARIVAATNRDLSAADPAVFRPDLYHRLSGYVIHVPPLRARMEDLIFLAKRFLDLTNQNLGKNVRGFSEAALDLLLGHDWPGNVRELCNVIRRAVLLADDVIDAGHLGPLRANGVEIPARRSLGGGAADNVSLKEIVRRSAVAVEREAIMQALQESGRNKAKAARLLKIDYKTMLTKLKKYVILEKGDGDDRQEREKRIT